MDNSTQETLIKDVAYIKAKVEALPELKKQVDLNTNAISKYRGVLLVISAICTFTLPTLFRHYLGK